MREWLGPYRLAWIRESRQQPPPLPDGVDVGPHAEAQHPPVVLPLLPSRQNLVHRPLRRQGVTWALLSTAAAGGAGLALPLHGLKEVKV